MKYIEEIGIGDCFSIKENYFIVTSDYKKNNDRFCINLQTGFGKWFSSDEMVANIDIFTLDIDSNVIAIKKREKNDISNQN
jgi:hypothetical protein